MTAGVVGLSGLVGPLVGCTPSSPDTAPTTRPPAPTRSTPPPAPDPDLPVLSAAADGERRLLGVYAAALEHFPDLRSELEEFMRRHEEHLAALTALIGPEAETTAAGVATTTPVAQSSRSGALAAIVAAEEAAVADRDDDLRAVQGAEHARLLAVIGACEAIHVVELGGKVEL